MFAPAPASARRLSALLALLLLLIALGSSAITQRASSAQFYIYDQQSVSVSSGELTEMYINFSIPINSTVIQSPPSAQLRHDGEGNPYLSIYEPHPALPYTYAINTTISTQAQSLTDLPVQWSAPPDAAADLQSTGPVPASDPAIARLAQQITANATTSFEQISALAQWVHDYITYNSSMVGQDLPADQILQQRQGVCTEYATLFVTLARSLGYPTRFVNGYAYSEIDNAWLGHAWAESYLGQWVSVDPTWLEVGNLDATHIVSSRQAAQDFEAASVSALVSPASAQLIWNGSETRGAIASDVHLVSEEEAPAITNYSLSISASRLPPGGQFVAYLAYPAADYRLLPLTLTPCQNENGPPILTLSPDGEQRLTTAPNQTSYAIWTGQAGTALEPSVRYTCPATLNSQYLSEGTLPINITTADPLDWPALLALPSHTVVAFGQTQSVFIRMPPSMAGHPVSVLESDLLLTAQLDGHGQATINFTPTRRGAHTLYVFSDEGDPVALNYSVALDNGLSITGVRTAQSAMAGAANQLLVTWSAPAGLDVSSDSLQWAWDGQNGQSPFVAGQPTMVLPFTPQSAGDSVLTLRILDPNGNELLRQSQPMTVLPGFNVTVDNVSLNPAPGPGQWQADIQINTSGIVQNLQLHVDNREFDVPPGGDVSLTLLPGYYNASLTWTDSTGSAQEETFAINAPAVPPSVLPSSLSVLSALPLPSKVFGIGIGLVISAGAVLAMLLIVFAYLWRPPPPGDAPHFS